MFNCPFMMNGYRIKPKFSYVRVLHASPDAPPVDVYLNDKLILRNLCYRDFSGYLPLIPNNYNIKIYAAGTKTNPVINKDVTLPMNTIATIAAIGKLKDIELFLIPDPVKEKMPQKAMVRFVHLSPDAPKVDVGILGGPKVFKNVGYKEITEYIPVDPKVYTLEVTLAGSDKKVLIVPNVKLKPNRFYTVYAVGLALGKPPLQVLIPLDGNSYINI